MTDETNDDYPEGFDPKAESTDPDLLLKALEHQKLNWTLRREDVEAKSPEELAEIILQQGEMIRRLYEVAMLPVQAEALGQTVDPKDIDNILNPENMT
jgi:hypothetical protein